MKKMRYPFSYLHCIFSPTKIFEARKNLNWFQLFFTSLFLTALLVIPMTLHVIQTKQFPVNQALPNMDQLITEDAAKAFQKLVVVEGHLTTTNSTVLSETESGIAGVLLKPTESAKKKISLVFSENQWVITDRTQETSTTYTMRYTDRFDPAKVTDKESFTQFLDEQFYLSNQASIILMMSISVGFFLFSMNALLVLGAAFFLWLTRKSRFSAIHTFKESLTMVINSLGAGSIAAFLVGVIYFDIIVMVGIQSLFLVVMLLASYVKTRFKGQLVEG